MSELSTFVQGNGQLLLAGVLLVLLLATLASQQLLLRRTKKLQRDIAEITGKVGAYLAVVMEAGEESSGERTEEAEAQAARRNGRSEEENSRLISAVLQEIFP